MASYKWKWMFKNGREITNVYGKYKILSTFSQPNSCQQTKGAVYLQVENLTREDLGTYMCALLESGTKIAVADVPFYEYGKLRVLNCIYLVRFDENYNFLIIRVTIPPRRTSRQVLLYHYHHQTPQATYIGCTHRNLSAWLTEHKRVTRNVNWKTHIPDKPSNRLEFWLDSRLYRLWIKRTVITLTKDKSKSTNKITSPYENYFGLKWQKINNKIATWLSNQAKNRVWCHQLSGHDHRGGDHIFCMLVSFGEVVVNTFVCHLVLLYFNTTKQANTLLKERVGLLIEHNTFRWKLCRRWFYTL